MKTFLVFLSLMPRKYLISHKSIRVKVACISNVTVKIVTRSEPVMRISSTYTNTVEICPFSHL